MWSMISSFGSAPETALQWSRNAMTSRAWVALVRSSAIRAVGARDRAGVLICAVAAFGLLGTCPKPFGPVVAITSTSTHSRTARRTGAGLAWIWVRAGEGKDVALRAVVVGGGIGGIAAAVALARAGIDVRSR